jgi:hypothetical protein
VTEKVLDREALLGVLPGYDTFIVRLGHLVREALATWGKLGAPLIPLCEMVRVVVVEGAAAVISAHNHPPPVIPPIRPTTGRSPARSRRPDGCSVFPSSIT